MNWYIVLALSVPFLFVIGVVYSAIKEQKVLEEGQLKKVLAERHAKGLINNAAGKGQSRDEEDDYGLPERQDLKRAAAVTASQVASAQDSASKTAPAANLKAAATVNVKAAAAAASVKVAPAAQVKGEAPAGTVNSAAASYEQEASAQAVPRAKRLEPLGNTEARDAASYFAKYYHDKEN